MHVLSNDERILASDFVLTQYTFFWSIKAYIDLIKRLKLYNSIITLFEFTFVLLLYTFLKHIYMYWPTKERY